MPISPPFQLLVPAPAPTGWANCGVAVAVCRRSLNRPLAAFHSLFASWISGRLPPPSFPDSLHPAFSAFHSNFGAVWFCTPFCFASRRCVGWRCLASLSLVIFPCFDSPLLLSQSGGLASAHLRLTASRPQSVAVHPGICSSCISDWSLPRLAPARIRCVEGFSARRPGFSAAPSSAPGLAPCLQDGHPEREEELRAGG